ncbi:MAG TPA: hypothetical protein DDZ51_10485 [Planctomycetaceae bacterium]|nr:hypothetical protein [Planctomycetaceae bacterium]
MNEKNADSVMLPGIYEQINLQCNKDQIAELLQLIQGRSNDARKAVRRSGEKEDLVVELKHAIERKFATFAEAVRLLQRCEESGNQTIFLFKPRNSAAAGRLRNGTGVAYRLFGECWGDGYFPKFERPREGLAWVDCRIGLEKRPNDWLLKAYGHTQRDETLENKLAIPAGKGKFKDVRLYEKRDINTVMVIRWRDPHYLEVRVDKALSRNLADTISRLPPIEEILRPAIDIKREMVAFSLKERVTQLVRDRSSHSGKGPAEYRLSRITVRDAKNGEIEFRPGDIADNIDDAPARSRSLDSLLNDGSEAARVPIEWITDEDVLKPFAPLRVDFEGDPVNAISVRSRISPEALDYVLSKFTANP